MSNKNQKWITCACPRLAIGSKILQICKNVLTYGHGRCIIIKHEIKSVEAKCGYIPTEIWNGGNFGGVCYGKDQAVRKCTYPKIIMQFLGFYIGGIQNTRVRFNLPR